MKISISGIHNDNIDRLSEWLSDYLKFPLIKNESDLIYKFDTKGIEFAGQKPLDSYYDSVIEDFELRLEKEKEHKTSVSNRTIFDGYLYLSQYYQRDMFLTDEKITSRITDYESKISKCGIKYDISFLLMNPYIEDESLKKINPIYYGMILNNMVSAFEIFNMDDNMKEFIMVDEKDFLSQQTYILREIGRFQKEKE